jgi:hypothetical protein
MLNNRGISLHIEVICKSWLFMIVHDLAAHGFPAKNLAPYFRRSEYPTATRNVRFDWSLPVRCSVTW